VPAVASCRASTTSTTTPSPPRRGGTRVDEAQHLAPAVRRHGSTIRAHPRAPFTVGRRSRHPAAPSRTGACGACGFPCRSAVYLGTTSPSGRDAAPTAANAKPRPL
jgi:hypothetical protein